MRELVSVKMLVLELNETMNYDLKGVSSVSSVSKGREDDVGTQNLAHSKEQLMASRTKHIGIKCHWFISKIQPKSIEIVRIDIQQ